MLSQAGVSRILKEGINSAIRGFAEAATPTPAPTTTSRRLFNEAPSSLGQQIVQSMPTHRQTLHSDTYDHYREEQVKREDLQQKMAEARSYLPLLCKPASTKQVAGVQLPQYFWWSNLLLPQSAANWPKIDFEATDGEFLN